MCKWTVPRTHDLPRPPAPRRDRSRSRERLRSARSRRPCRRSRGGSPTSRDRGSGEDRDEQRRHGRGLPHRVRERSGRLDADDGEPIRVPMRAKRRRVIETHGIHPWLEDAVRHRVDAITSRSNDRGRSRSMVTLSRSERVSIRTRESHAAGFMHGRERGLPRSASRARRSFDTTKGPTDARSGDWHLHRSGKDRRVRRSGDGDDPRSQGGRGVVAHAYQRVDGTGVRSSGRSRASPRRAKSIGQLLFSQHGLMTVELTEIAEFPTLQPR